MKCRRISKASHQSWTTSFLIMKGKKTSHLSPNSLEEVEEEEEEGEQEEEDEEMEEEEEPEVINSSEEETEMAQDEQEGEEAQDDPMEGSPKEEPEAKKRRIVNMVEDLQESSKSGGNLLGVWIARAHDV